jgi:sortase A
MLLIGLSLLLYPSVSNYWNSLHQTRAIAGYTEAVAEIDTEELDKMWEEAQQYNSTLLKNTNRWNMSKEEKKEYESLLNVGGDGVMASINIPSLRLSLPIYHGVDEEELQIAVGHIPGTSLPVGGKGTHCVLSGHRGLPSAKLFSDLNMLTEGDIFIINTLDRTLTYEVDQIRIVLPDELDDLAIDPEQDYCTLVTCTPYGVNTHRLLVRGHRIPNIQGEVQLTADALQYDPVMVAPLVAIPMLLLLLVWLLFHYRDVKGKNKNGVGNKKIKRKRRKDRDT